MFRVPALRKVQVLASELAVDGYESVLGGVLPNVEGGLNRFFHQLLGGATTGLDTGGPVQPFDEVGIALQPPNKIGSLMRRHREFTNPPSDLRRCPRHFHPRPVRFSG